MKTDKNNNLKKAVGIIVVSAFVFYCLAVISCTFILNRSVFEKGNIADYFVRSNYIPFKTIITYIGAIFNKRMNVDLIIYNLFGNLAVLFPLGCFLPCLFAKCRKFLVTFAFALGTVCLIELFQPLLCVGLFDIDDIILNTAGACLGFLFVSILPVKRLLKALYIYKE